MMIRSDIMAIFVFKYANVYFLSDSDGHDDSNKVPGRNNKAHKRRAVANRSVQKHIVCNRVEVLKN